MYNIKLQFRLYIILRFPQNGTGKKNKNKNK